MLSRNLLLIFLVFFPVCFLCFVPKSVYAQIDLDEDDSEADVEDMRPEPDSAVVGQETFLNEEDPATEKTLKASPDAETTFLFTQPAQTNAELPAGKDVHFLVGFANKGNKDFIIESMDASFRYPLDFTYHIQNFSAIPYNRAVKPKQDVALYYAFYTSETYSARPFGLVVNLHYRDADGKQYLDAVFNETVTIVEIEESLDGETFFLYVLLAACFVLIVVVSQQFLVNFTKRKISSKKIEMGTQNKRSDIDYDWLPKETLQSLNKSEAMNETNKYLRRSERVSPKQHKNSVSPKTSPKQRKVKRGVRDD